MDGWSFGHSLKFPKKILLEKKSYLGVKILFHLNSTIIGGSSRSSGSLKNSIGISVKIVV